MIAFAAACDTIAATSSTLAKVAALAAYLRTLADDDLDAAARFFTGSPFAQRDDRVLAVGPRTIVAAAQAAWDVDRTALAVAYQSSGDLGEALGRFVREPMDLGLFRFELTPARLGELFDELAAAAGKTAANSRKLICQRILGACTQAREATYVIKIVAGELRIGLRDGLILEGIAQAFDVPIDDIRRAAMAAGDIGLVARTARAGTLADIEVAYGAPIAFMLASPLAYAGTFADLGTGAWLIEDKYDGVRVQAHVDGQSVRLFSRTLGEVTRTWPDIVNGLRALGDACILDGEIIAERDGRVLPFRELATRLQRKDVEAELLADVPAVFIAFDILARGGTFLLDEPLATRRTALDELVPTAGAIRRSTWQTLESGSTADVIHETFDAARMRGHEGLMFKRTDAAYIPGKRGKAWLKLKKELTTMDVVVVGVEWGHGKRSHVLSDYTFAVRGEVGDLLPLGKAYSGLTDVEIAEMTRWFLDHRLPEDEAAAAYERLGLQRREIVVEPSTVIEVAFDIVQPSTLHRSGFALRFPRIARLRPDKPASEIDSIADVRRIFAAMRARETG